MHQPALGDVDEITSVDDFARQFGKIGAGAGGGRPGSVKRAQFGHEPARRLPVIVAARLCEGLMQPRDVALAAAARA